MKNIKMNFIYQFIYQLSLVVLPIITIPIISKSLGVYGIGKWNYINSIVNYFILFAGLGLANYGIREIAIVRENKFNLSVKFWELQFFNMFFSTIVFIVYIFFSLFMEDKALFLIQAISVFSVIVDIAWFFGGIEDFKKITIVNVTIKIFSFFLILFLVRSPENIIEYFYIQSLSLICSQLILWFFIKNKIIWVGFLELDIFKHFKPALSYFTAKIGQTLFNNINKTILGIFSTLEMVGIYSNSLTLVLMSGSLLNALNIIMIPHMSYLNEHNDQKGLLNELKKNLHLQLYLTICIMFGIILVNEKMVIWFFGEEFQLMKSIVPIIAPTLVLQSLHGAIAAQYLIPKGKMKSYNISVFIGIFLSVILTIACVPFIGVKGAAIGNLIGQLVVCLLRISILYKETNIKLEYVLVIKWLFSGSCMLIVCKLLTYKLNDTILTTFIQTILGMIIYLLITFLLKANLLIKIKK